MTDLFVFENDNDGQEVKNGLNSNFSGLKSDIETSITNLQAYADQAEQDAKDYAENYTDTSIDSLVNGPYPYIHLGMSATQTIDNGSTINFDTVRKSNTLTRNGSGINVQAGKTYKLMAYVSFQNGTVGPYCGFQFYDNTTPIGQGWYHSAPNAATGYMLNTEGMMYYTPSVDTVIYVKATDDQIGTGVISNVYNTYFIAEQLTGMKGDKGDTGLTGGLDGPTPYIHKRMSTQQAVDSGTIVAFDTTYASNGITGNGYGVNVEAGKTYRIMAWIDFENSITSPHYASFGVYDNTTLISPLSYFTAPISTAGHGMNAPVWKYYTPLTDSIIYIKCSDDGLGTGRIQSGWGTMFIVEQVVGMKGDKGDTGDVSVSDITFEGWTAPTLLNSWVRYDMTWGPAEYCKDALGFVHLRGLIRAGTTGTPIFILPIGYRPQYQELFIVDSNAARGRIDIYSNGEVRMQSGNNAYLQLSGITFKAA